MARIIAACNAKGGTGKTTVSANLAATLAHLHGKKVLCVDLDAQGSFGISFGLDPRHLELTTFNLLTAEAPDIRDYIVEIEQVPNLYLIPNAISADLETRLESSHNRDSLLKMRLRQIRRDFDYIIIDTPPAMRTATMNALVAADEVIVVIDCGYYALYGLNDLMREIARVQDAYEKEQIIVRGLLNMFNKGQNLDRDIKREVFDFFGGLMIQTVIHKNVRIGEATSAHMPIIIFDRTASGSFDFVKLTKELLAEYEPEEEKRTSRLVK